jgi:transposase
MNSSNSSNPPSSDGPGAARKAKAPRGKSGRKPGKQPGTPGTTLGWAADPRVVDHVPASCGGCGCDLSGAPGAGVVRRQVVDIPEVSAFAVEHRLHKRRCACGRTTTAPAPEGVDAPVQYGANLRALACYLVVFQHVPAERAALLIADVTGARVSTGWVARTVARTASLLADTEAFIKTLLTLAHVLHVDETSTSIAGNTQWLHVACTDTLTAYHLHPSRGLVAVGAFGVLPVFAGTVVHDSLAQYRPENFPLSRHALCGAHIWPRSCAPGCSPRISPRPSASPWTSAPPPAPSRRTCAALSSPGTGTAPTPAAGSGPPPARSTTSHHGPRAAPPPWPTWSCSAHSTT